MVVHEKHVQRLALPLVIAMKMTLKIKPLSAWLGRVLSRFPFVYESVIRLASRLGAIPSPTCEGVQARVDAASLSPRARKIYEQLKQAFDAPGTRES